MNTTKLIIASEYHIGIVWVLCRLLFLSNTSANGYKPNVSQRFFCFVFYNLKKIRDSLASSIFELWQQQKTSACIWYLFFNQKIIYSENCHFWSVCKRLVKIHIFWEGQKILWTLHLTFDWHYIGQKYSQVSIKRAARLTTVHCS